MNRFQNIQLRRTVPALAVAIAALLSIAGCSKNNKPQAKKAAAPAKVEKHSESSLATITLTAKAVERLGVSLGTVETQLVPRVRRFGGEVMIPPGNGVIISAPMPGTISLPEGQPMITPGQHVSAGETLFTFTPLLPPEREVPSPVERIQMATARASLTSMQITADGDVQRGKAELEGAEIALKRAKQLLEDRAGSARAVDDAEALMQIASKTLEAAVERADLLKKLTLESKLGKVESMPMTAPVSGTLQALNVTRGQNVAVGQILFEVADLDKLWIKVPVYVGQLKQFNLKANATISGLTINAGEKSLQASPVKAPPTANALASTADLYFEIDNKSGELRPGQRVGVSLPLAEEAESLTVLPEPCCTMFTAAAGCMCRTATASSIENVLLSNT